MGAPTIITSSVTLRCTCGREMEIDDIHEGYQHVMPCDCGLRPSVQFDDPILQFDRPRQARP